jgi:anti-sigma factor RsiW
MTNRTERGPVAHAGHDPLLIVQFAADDLDPRGRETAEQLVESCSECARLATDLRLIARATSELPAPVRSRDFTLTPDQAARLRRTSWRSLANRLGWVRGGFGRTLAAGLTTIGLAGLLIGTIPANFSLGLSGSAAASPTAAQAPDNMAESGPSAAASAAPAPSGAAASGGGGSGLGFGPLPSVGPSGSLYDRDRVGVTGEQGSGGKLYGSEQPPGSSTDDRLATRDSSYSRSPNTLLAVSLVSLAAGIGLFALRRVSSRPGV